MPGLGKRLMRGHITISPDLIVRVLDHDGVEVDRILPQALVGGAWGYVYERCVGLHFEALGYAVTYRGTTLGYLDGGVDLVAEREGERRFVQCKFVMKALGPSQVEWLLYKASRHVAHNLEPGRRSFFELAVPSLAIAFPPRRRNGRTAQQSTALRRLHHANQVQRDVTVLVSEIPLPVDVRFPVDHVHDSPTPQSAGATRRETADDS